MNISKALLIGINYKNSQNRLEGCYNDIIKIANFIDENYGVNQIMILSDEYNEYNQPTKKNIIQAINWLVNGAVSGQCLFFHYSGHGSQVKTTDIHEIDGLDETICPVDFKENGMICDGELKYYLVDPLPVGCKLTCIMDCCHSGTGLDLKYVCEYDKNNDILNHMSVNINNKSNLLKFNDKIINKFSKLDSYYLKDNGYKDSNAEVIMISGCKASQTSCDAHIQNVNCGAMTFSFIEALSHNININYITLMQTMNKILINGNYQQNSQIHFSKNTNIKDIFQPNSSTKYTNPSLNHELPIEIEIIKKQFNKQKYDKVQSQIKPSTHYTYSQKPHTQNSSKIYSNNYSKMHINTNNMSDNLNTYHLNTNDISDNPNNSRIKYMPNNSNTSHIKYISNNPNTSHVKYISNDENNKNNKTSIF
jgi:hypothetical protein